MKSKEQLAFDEGYDMCLIQTLIWIEDSVVCKNPNCCICKELLKRFNLHIKKNKKGADYKI